MQLVVLSSSFAAIALAACLATFAPRPKSDGARFLEAYALAALLIAASRGFVAEYIVRLAGLFVLVYAAMRLGPVRAHSSPAFLSERYPGNPLVILGVFGLCVFVAPLGEDALLPGSGFLQILVWAGLAPTSRNVATFLGLSTLLQQSWKVLL